MVAVARPVEVRRHHRVEEDPVLPAVVLAELEAGDLGEMCIRDRREAVLAGNRGTLPRVVSDATGNSQVFAAALGLAADHGTVVILGDTGDPGGQHLTGDVIRRGLTIVGVHDLHNTPEWNNASIIRLLFDLAAGGRFPLAGLNTHYFGPAQCAEAYATANRDRSKTMGLSLIHI